MGVNLMETAVYQQRAEAFWQAEVSALYHMEAGLADNSDKLAQTYRTYADLYSLEQVQNLLTQVQSSNDARFIAEFATLRYLRQLTFPHDQAFWQRLGKSTLEWEGQTVPFFALTNLLATERDAQKRRILYEERSRLVIEANHIKKEGWQAVQSHLPELGFKTYRALCDDLRGLHLTSLQASAEIFLAATSTIYFTQFKHWSQVMLGVETAVAADMFYLMQGAQFDALFPKEHLKTTLHNVLHAYEIPLTSESGLKLDLETRPNKSPRPFCAFVQVPNEIKLVINPVGGHQDYKAAFHELGHALHGLHISASLPFTQRYLGDDSVGEAFAFLFETIPSNLVWLQNVMKLTDDEHYVAYMQFIQLLFARRCAAKVLYENLLHIGVDEPETCYSSLLNEHLGINVSPAYYLLDVDDGFYNAQYFRAWMLSAQMRACLNESVGSDWPISPETASFLRPLWKTGQLPAETMSKQIGFKNLTPEALIAEFQI